MSLRTWNDLGLALWRGLERLAVAVGLAICAVAVGMGVWEVVS